MSTLLLESVVEASLIAAIVATPVTGVTAQGFWNPADAGDVKTSNADTAANIFVAVAPRSYASYGTKTCRFLATVTLKVLPSNDPTAASLGTLFKTIMALCMSWKDDAAVARSALSTANEFSCDGVTIMPGGQLGVSAEAWTVSIQLEIAGTEV